MEISKDEMKTMKTLQFLSTIPKVIVLNVGERDVNTDYTKTLEAPLLNRYPSANILTLCGKIEMEISQLPEDEKNLFFHELGIEEPVSNRLINICYQTLGLVSFLTVGEDEVRAWTIRSNTTAVNAAGKVHSDIERGFIRAEVMKYNEFVRLGSEHACKEAGRFFVEGKNYVVEDGDILHIRFNV